MGAQSRHIVGAAMVMTGVLGAPVIASAQDAPIISIPTSGVVANPDTSAGLLSLLRELRGIRDQLRSLENQSEIENHRIERLRAQQQSFFADFARQLRLLRHQQGQMTSGGTIQGNLPPSSASVAPASGVSAPPSSSVPSTSGSAAPGAGNANSTPAVTPPSSSVASGVTSPTAPANVSPGAAQAGSGTGSSGSGVTPPPVGSASAQAAYDKAFNLLRAGLYHRAIGAFHGFLATYPANKRASKAQYWIAETEYVERNYPAARTAFKTLVTQYPSSTKVPNALLKIGYIAKWEGKPIQARKTWNGLIRRYPSSTAAQVARSALSNLGPNT